MGVLPGPGCGQTPPPASGWRCGRRRCWRQSGRPRPRPGPGPFCREVGALGKFARACQAQAALGRAVRAGVVPACKRALEQSCSTTGRRGLAAQARPPRCRSGARGSTAPGRGRWPCCHRQRKRAGRWLRVRWAGNPAGPAPVGARCEARQAQHAHATAPRGGGDSDDGVSHGRGVASRWAGG